MAVVCRRALHAYQNDAPNAAIVAIARSSTHMGGCSSGAHVRTQRIEPVRHSTAGTVTGVRLVHVVPPLTEDQPSHRPSSTSRERSVSELSQPPDIRDSR